MLLFVSNLPMGIAGRVGSDRARNIVDLLLVIDSEFK